MNIQLSVSFCLESVLFVTVSHPGKDADFSHMKHIVKSSPTARASPHVELI